MIKEWKPSRGDVIIFLIPSFPAFYYHSSPYCFLSVFLAYSFCSRINFFSFRFLDLPFLNTHLTMTDPKVELEAPVTHLWHLGEKDKMCPKLASVFAVSFKMKSAGSTDMVKTWQRTMAGINIQFTQGFIVSSLNVGKRRNNLRKGDYNW